MITGNQTFRKTISLLVMVLLVVTMSIPASVYAEESVPLAAEEVETDMVTQEEAEPETPEDQETEIPEAVETEDPGEEEIQQELQDANLQTAAAEEIQNTEVAAEEEVQQKAAEEPEEETADYKAVYKITGDYLAGLGTPTVNSIGGEWMVIGLARSGRSVPSGYYDNAASYIDQKINEKEQLHRVKSTDNSRVILGLTAAGINPTDVNGHNLLEGLTDLSYVKKQGINGPIWALIAFDSHDYQIPEGGTVTREVLIQTILSAQLSDGGWALSGSVSDPDMTGMALQALAPYYSSNASVAAAANKALSNLSRKQNEDGTYSSGGDSNAESCAQVIVALTALGIDPDKDARFIKNGASAVDGLLTFAVDGGGFRHVAGTGRDGMSTEQGYYALTAYDRFLKGKTSLYDMTDITIAGLTIETDEPKTEEADTEADTDKTEETAATDKKTTAKAATKFITKGATIKLHAEKSTAAKKIIAQMDSIVKADLPENASDYTDDQIQEIIEIYKAYAELTKAEQLAVEQDDNYKAFAEILAKIGKRNHYDEATEADVTDNPEEILPWYVQLKVEPKELTEEQEDAVKAVLGDESRMFTVHDISFINLLDDEEWHPETAITVKLTMADIGSYNNAVIVHITDEGKIQILDGQIEGDVITFQTADFSLYGIAGTDTSVSDMLASEEPAVIWPWIAAAAAALLLILLLAYRKKKQN